MNPFSDANMRSCYLGPPPWKFVQECKWCFYEYLHGSGDVLRFRPKWKIPVGFVFLLFPCLFHYSTYEWWKFTGWKNNMKRRLKRKFNG